MAALVNKARSGRRIFALDGCPLQCVENLILSHYGLRKRYGEDCTEAESDELFEQIRQLIASDARRNHGSELMV